MIRKFYAVAAILAASLSLGACALFQDSGDVSVEWAKAQGLYNETVEELIDLREPCVPTALNPDYGPENPDCLISDALYVKIEQFRITADGYLKAADTAIQNGDPNAAVYTQAASGALLAIIRYRAEAGVAAAPAGG